MKNLLLASLIALLVGATVGWVAHGWKTGAAQQKQTAQAIERSATNIVTSNETSQAVEKKADEVVAPVTAAHAAIQKHLKKRRAAAAKEKTNEAICKPTGPIVVGDVPVVLDQRTVELLDAAREGRTIEPAAGSDGAGKAPSDVEVEEFIDNDGQVVRQYKDLATRHDALVDWVEGELRKQAQQ
ncbi:hypothetical protein FQZ97_998980 [compost metagenome]